MSNLIVKFTSCVMGKIKQWNKWANAHSYYAIALLRVVLGVFLFWKGVDFMSDSDRMAAMMGPLEKIPGAMIFLHYVAPAHFVGGFLIAIGLLTRWAVAAQIPILIGAVLINFFGEMNATNLIMAVVTLIVCCFFFFYGSGKRSVDYYFKMQQ